MEVQEVKNGKYNFTKEDLYKITSTVFAENGFTNDKAISHTIDTILNRVGNDEWKDKNLDTILTEGYYGTRGKAFDGNGKYDEGLNILNGSGKYGNDSINEVKRILHQVYSKAMGFQEVGLAQHYLLDSEAAKQSWVKNTYETDYFETKGKKEPKLFRTYANKSFINKNIQNRINELGGELEVDGIIGNKTRKAYDAYKDDKKLSNLWNITIKKKD